jgi:hypothetical protein
LKELLWSFENTCTCRIVDPKITINGLFLQGYLWRIDKQVFFEELQHHPKFARIYWEILVELHRQDMLELANAIWRFVRAEVGHLHLLLPALNKNMELNFYLRMIREIC